jgi:hypothetical protein
MTDVAVILYALPIQVKSSDLSVCAIVGRAVLIAVRSNADRNVATSRPIMINQKRRSLGDEVPSCSRSVTVSAPSDLGASTVAFSSSGGVLDFTVSASMCAERSSADEAETEGTYK